MGLPHYVRVGAAESDESTSTLVDLPASRGGAWLRLYGGWVLAGVVCLLWALAPRGHAAKAEECFDPFTAPGYIWRPENGSIRHIPYPPSASLADLTTFRPIGELADPPEDALRLAAPAYGDLLEREERADLPELRWMRDKTIVFIGDSHDRQNLEIFCDRLHSTGAVLSVPHYHIKAHCRLPDLNLTLAQWFHFGLAPESDSLPPDAWNIPSIPTSHVNENPAPYSIEGKMKEYWLSDVEEIGKPDLIVLNSFFWDLRYFTLRAKHFIPSPSPLHATERPLTYSELAWHRSRVRDFVDLVREKFPGVPLMWKTGQERESNRGYGNVAVYQLNQSLRAVLNRLNIPVFDWGALITGEWQYNDDQHLKPGAPARLWADMAFWYLRRAVNGCECCIDPPLS
ncbi:hypothetical protein NBRC10512_002726 [Rhodotorula toruloides]|uniref:RHTO0S11e05952g1_1 n=2 Tax=Rhodotorula toruloides TaxID=5286 RepID=A0A061B7J5_RHOTO|nr:Esterase, SGNH hydrolase-type domain protein [Rhodotorula toruloides NP11]EMS21546.1 Esterase, SGNH hydrolase-type domain protein [Rhodotorula toruloides NP11]KAJ8292549.1 hypothetical protein OF846_004319 [Rhodotorula toruloides]CDR45883.1 RHTO0S11e05952g1_1 [Rhodotorula toruloides]